VPAARRYLEPSYGIRTPRDTPCSEIIVTLARRRRHGNRFPVRFPLTPVYIVDAAREQRVAGPTGDSLNTPHCHVDAIQEYRCAIGFRKTAPGQRATIGGIAGVQQIASGSQFTGTEVREVPT